MTQKLVGMHDKFGSLYQPIPIFDIPYAAMKMIVYEAVLPPVMLGGWSSLFFVVSVIFLGERWIIPTHFLMRCTETQNNQLTKILTEDYFPVS